MASTIHNYRVMATCPDEETARVIAEYLDDNSDGAWRLEAPWQGHQGDCWVVYYDGDDDDTSHVESILRNRNTAHTVSEEEILRALSLNDAEVYQVLARYAHLRDILIDATYECIRKLTETPPGPSSVAYNAAMSYLGRKEKIGELEKVQVYTTENPEEAYFTWNRKL